MTIMGTTPSVAEFSAYLQNNNPADETDILPIRQLIASPKEEKDRVREQADRLVEEVARLRTRQAQVEDTIEKHAGIISPLRRLSTDLLRLIFSFCLPTRTDPTLSEDEAPLVLTRLCRRWRDVALHAPELWARLYIPLPARPIRRIPTRCSPRTARSSARWRSTTRRGR